MQIGIDAMNGLYDGFASMESTLYKKLEEIAYNLTNTIKTTFPQNAMNINIYFFI